ENGSVTSASTLEERFLLGNLLCRQGVIDPIQLNEALAKQKEYDLPLGETLLKMGVAQRETIDYVVRSQIQDGVNDVFRWRHGGFLFAESPKSESRASGSGFHVQPLLMEALRSLDEWELVAEKFTDRRRVPVFVEGKKAKRRTRSKAPAPSQTAWPSSSWSTGGVRSTRSSPSAAGTSTAA
ncbi:MAG: DUF4388 domain-containing protein, partial [Planctomycetota bacterium]